MRFTRKKKIGEGATATVFEAHDHVSSQTVALKEFRKDAGLPHRELWLAQKINDPHVCRVHDIHVENGLLSISIGDASETTAWPKSEIFTVPSLAIRTFSGFKS